MHQNATLFSLSRKQIKAVKSLFIKSDVTAAAAAAGVHRTTIHRWMSDEDFLQALRLVEVGHLERISLELDALDTAVIRVLERGLESGSLEQQLKTVEIILNHQEKIHGLIKSSTRLNNLEMRIERLEDRFVNLLLFFSRLIKRVDSAAERLARARRGEQ